MNDIEIQLSAHAVANLRRGETVIDRAANGVTLQLVGPAAGVVMEFADAVNVYLSAAELDLIERDAAGQIVNVGGVRYSIRIGVVSA